MNSWPALISSALLIAASPTIARSPEIEGRWLTDDGKAVVLVAPCGNALCGSIEQILDKGAHVPVADTRNPDPGARSRPLVGLPILTGFIRDGAVWKDGHAYDPKSGKSYRASLAVNPAHQLVVTGCVLFFCQSRYWTRPDLAATRRQGR